MKGEERYELPPELEREMRRAVRLEWATIGLMAPVVAVVGAAMGGSQAMKAAWVEDMLAFVPPAAFLVSARYRHRGRDREFPYGRHRAVSIAFLAGSVALAIFGGFILIDSAASLVRREHPTIGTVVIFGEQFWAGWLMIGALAYSAAPPLVLGRLKHGPSGRLHDKTLRADADMNRADWMTAAAGIVGIAGIGFGLWWADAAAGAAISVSIVRDGVKNLKRVTADLMDRAPKTVDGEPSDVPERVEAALRALPWVAWAEVRLREEGHVYFGEAYVRLRSGEDVAGKVAEAKRAARAVDWRVYDVVIAVEQEAGE